MTSAFSPGSTSAMTSSTPIRSATARAVGSLSPVSRIVRRPSSRSCATASREHGLIRSATTNSACAAPSQLAAIAVRPSASAATRALSSSGGSASDGSALSSSAGRPAMIARPATVPWTPRPGRFVKSSTGRGRRLQALRGRRDRAPDRVLGAVLQRADEPQRLRLADALGDLQLLQRHAPGRRRAGLVDDDRVDRAASTRGSPARGSARRAARRGRCRRAAPSASRGRARTGRR